MDSFENTAKAGIDERFVVVHISEIENETPEKSTCKDAGNCHLCRLVLCSDYWFMEKKNR